MTPTIGRIVIFTGNLAGVVDATPQDQAAAIVCGVNQGASPTVNLWVFPNTSGNPRWIANVTEHAAGGVAGTWRWPPRSNADQELLAAHAHADRAEAAAGQAVRAAQAAVNAVVQPVTEPQPPEPDTRTPSDFPKPTP